MKDKSQTQKLLAEIILDANTVRSRMNELDCDQYSTIGLIAEDLRDLVGDVMDE